MMHAHCLVAEKGKILATCSFDRRADRESPGDCDCLWLHFTCLVFVPIVHVLCPLIRAKTDEG